MIQKRLSEPVMRVIKLIPDDEIHCGSSCCITCIIHITDPEGFLKNLVKKPDWTKNTSSYFCLRASEPLAKINGGPLDKGAQSIEDYEFFIPLHKGDVRRTGGSGGTM